jgi:biofilm PGA synthesis N-glycosyltransferase PgaC
MEISPIVVVAFWLSVFVVFYAYVGYGILLYTIVKIKRLFGRGKVASDPGFEPEVSFVIPCYNELDYIEAKARNCLNFEYPKDKIKIIFITDGSNDGSNLKAESIPGVKVLHQNARKGKSAAENRAMQYIDTPIVVFSDANTILPTNAIRKIVQHYADPLVGAVSGEKRILEKNKDTASGAGEGMYWKYESFLKKLDSELLTIVGAAGELFSFRKELYTQLEEDTILDDFISSLRIAQKGYRVIYEPEAYAMEAASESVSEELKRKIRICAGAWQSMTRLSSLLNPFTNLTLTFQYISHRVLRWSIVPVLLLLLLPLNLVLINSGFIYKLFFIGQLTFYSLALSGWYLASKAIKIKSLFIPYYFFIMNYAVYLGFYRYIKGSQAAAWERSQRGKMANS